MCDAKLSLKVMINKEKNKVLFAECNNYFVDILLSFLTLPLGRIVKLLKNHFKDNEIPTIGSLNSLYNSLENLDSVHFVTEAAKQTLLNPTSSFEAEYERLKLDITDSPPAEYFKCANCPSSGKRDKKRCETASDGDEVFTINKASFIISDYLHIMPNDTGYLSIISTLGVTDMDKAEQIDVELGFDEVMKILKASLTSSTPLSDVILNKTTEMNYSPSVESQPQQIASDEGDDSKSKRLCLKVMIQKSTSKFLYAQAKEEFVEFLFSLLNVPLGGAEHLLAGKPCVEAVDNLYRSVGELIGENYFKQSTDAKKRLMKPYDLAHGCFSKSHILVSVVNHSWPCTHKFPNGQGSFVEGPRTYEVKDDLTVVPFCFASIVSSLVEKKVAVDDVQELEMEIGFKEGLRILKASLTSTCALTDALLTHIPKKQPKAKVSNVIHGSHYLLYQRLNSSYDL